MELAYILLGFILGWIIREQVAITNIKSILNAAELEEDSPAEEKVLIKVEYHNGVLFAYSQLDDSFIVQANNSDELKEKLSKLFPNRTIACDAESLLLLRDH